MAWLLVFGLVAGMVAARIGVFTPLAVVETAGGQVAMPDALASVDHPFHIARAELLRQSLLAGELPRWIANHQGGYPVEFYPLGVAWLEVAVWAAALGTLAMPSVHTIVVAVLFLLPLGAFVLLARQDGWPFRAAMLATVLHVVVPGDWWHGGYTELVQWGLVTNVAGAVAGIYFLALLSRYLTDGVPWAGGLAIATGAMAVYCNPRSGAALAVAGLAVWLASLIGGGRSRASVARATWRLGLVATGGVLLAAPQLGSFVRYSDLYAFVRYERYLDLTAYVTSSANAVSTVGLLLAAGGAVWSFTDRERRGTMAIALALLLYVGLTGAATFAADLVPQLEATRLMPFQRLLMVYLAAVVLERGAHWLVQRAAPHRMGTVAHVALAAAAAGVFLIRLAPADAPAPVPARTDPMSPALYAVTRAAAPAQADLETAVRVADAAAMPGTGLLVIGSALSWHQQLWAPLWTNRSLMYDDWLWGWNRQHIGTPGYRWEAGNFYPDPAATLAPEYLARYGIGAIVVTGPVAAVAADANWLSLIRSGTYATYVVNEPFSLVTFGGTNPTAIDIRRQAVSASGSGQVPGVGVRQNWFPRWEARANGQPVAVVRGPGGQIAIETAPAASDQVEAWYGTTPVDWVLRGAAAAGLVLSSTLTGSWLVRRGRDAKPPRGAK